MRRSLAIAALGFAVLVASGLHGFSISAWHRLLDQSPESEVLLGEARRIRGDDWFVTIPLSMAQRAHDPRFPRVNRLIGFGQDVSVPVAVPIAHPIAAFRPATWGWFLGDDFGLAWWWWSHAFGIAVAWAAVAWLVCGGRLGLAWACGALVLLAPVVQLTSLGAAPILATSGFAIAGALGVRSARTRPGVAAWALLLAWSTASLILAFYPPYQISVGWIAVAAVAPLWLAREARAPRARWLVAVAALAAGVAMAGLVAWSIADAIQTIAATRYPGQRISEGGTIPAWAPFATNLAAGARLGAESQQMAFAGSLLFFPVLAFGELARARRGRVDPVAWALVAVLAILLAHTVVSLPEWLKSATLLSRVPEGRTRVALAVADALLLARVLADARAEAASRREAIAGAALFAAGIALCARSLHLHHPSLGVAATLALVVANAAVAYALLRRARPVLLLAAIAAFSGALTLGWNPLVRGGAAYLRENAVSQQILALDREAGGRSMWVAYGPPALGNVFRAIGVHALNGVHPIPQLALWKVLDPSEAYRKIYDRYAHVLFAIDPSESPRFEPFGPDGFKVWIAPSSRVLACVGVTHVLVRTGEDAAPLDLLGQPGLTWLRSIGGNHFFRLGRGMTRATCADLGIMLPSRDSRDPLPP